MLPSLSWSRMLRGCPIPLLVGVLTVLGLAGCHQPVIRAEPPLAAEKASEPACEVEEYRDIAYYRGKDFSTFRHRLDLFLPKGKQDYPVVVLIHGGAWMIGDRSCCGWYSSVGRFLAEHGIGAVLPSYRLSPWVQHPEHIKDVARAYAWTHSHIAEYGGNPDRMFIAGHSAGGHLAALLATDSQYLRAEGLRPEDVRGVIAVCGVYRIPRGNLYVTLGGNTPNAFRLNELVPLPGLLPRSDSPTMGGIPLSLNFFGPAFGDDPRVREEASPINHVRPGLPPFLLFSAESDLPTLAGMAEDFDEALRDEGCESHWVTIKGRNHNDIFFRIVRPDDPVAKEMLEFIRQHGR